MNDEKTLYCPFRKEISKSGLTKTEDFLPCLKKDCALWSIHAGGHCGLKQL